MLVRWQPFQEMEEVRRQLDRLFRDFASIDQEFCPACSDQK